MANDWGKALFYPGMAPAQPWQEGEGRLLSVDCAAIGQVGPDMTCSDEAKHCLSGVLLRVLMCFG